MPSTTSKLVSPVFDSSIVITPSRPTFSTADAIRLPTSESLLPEIVATCFTCSSESISIDIFLMYSITCLTVLSIEFLISTALEP